ncbi:MAG: hypothetical protein IE926_07765 [Micrococcales bacterium]|nr:hypothetical protein [Micrococcales bacterium]
MNAVTVEARTEDVRAYIGAVRAWLADLPPEDVDELTLGMEADLTERAAEGDVLLGELLGEPEEYAAELRSAAGLPPRAATVEGASSPGWVATLVASGTEVGTAAVERWPWLRDLRPVWWVARGWALGWGLAAVLGTGHFLLVPVLCAAVSFWLGRRTAVVVVPRGVATVVLAANLLGVVLLLPAAASTLDPPQSGGADAWVPPGVSLDGSTVSNLYVYDGRGNRVDGARLFDQNGNPVYVDPSSVTAGDDVPMRPDGYPDVATNAFPLVVGGADPWGATDGWAPPLTLAPVPVLPSPSPTASDAASPTPAVSSSSTATPSGAVPSPPATPTPTVSGG